jgi:hypothetical protein
VSASLPAIGTTNGAVVYKVIGSIENQMTMNTFYYQAAVPAPTQAQLQTLLANISAGLFSFYQNCISSDWVTVRETIDVVHRNDISGQVRTNNAGQLGLRPSTHEPTEVATVVIRYSAIKGQHGRGRVSLPAPSAADVTGSRITGAGMLTALTNLQTNMVLSFSDGVNAWTPCIVQRSTTSPKLVIGSSQIVRTIANLLLGTVRRRKIGRGK